MDHLKLGGRATYNIIAFSPFYSFYFNLSCYAGAVLRRRVSVTRSSGHTRGTALKMSKTALIYLPNSLATSDCESRDRRATTAPVASTGTVNSGHRVAISANSESYAL